MVIILHLKCLISNLSKMSNRQLDSWALQLTTLLVGDSGKDPVCSGLECAAVRLWIRHLVGDFVIAIKDLFLAKRSTCGYQQHKDGTRSCRKHKYLMQKWVQRKKNLVIVPPLRCAIFITLAKLLGLLKLWFARVSCLLSVQLLLW